MSNENKLKHRAPSTSYDGAVYLYPCDDGIDKRTLNRLLEYLPSNVKLIPILVVAGTTIMIGGRFKMSDMGYESIAEAVRAPIKGFKGFDVNLRCKGYQFEVGRAYKEEEPVLCVRGFHLCENPLDAMSYYPPAFSRYCRVEGSGLADYSESGSKVAVSELLVKEEIGLNKLIREAIDWVFDRPIKAGTLQEDLHKTTSVFYDDAINTNCRGHAVTAGSLSNAVTMGEHAHAVTAGNISHAYTFRRGSRAATLGYKSFAVTASHMSDALTAGNEAPATANGDNAHAVTEGEQSHAVTHGCVSCAATRGSSSHAISTGDRSDSFAGGSGSHAVALGADSRASTSKEGSISLGLGPRCTAKAALGCWLVLAEYDFAGHLKGVKTAKVDGGSIKANVPYTLKKGKFVRVKEENNRVVCL